MTTAQLRALLPDVPNGPPSIASNEDDVFVVQMPSGSIIACSMRYLFHVMGRYVENLTRHAPLPDFGAMARELEELRAKVEDLGMRARVGCGDCLGTGEGEDAPCDACDGAGWIYRRRADWVAP